MKSKEHYQRLGIPYKKSILLHGIPGTGKTCLAYALANYFKLPLIKTVFKSNDILGAIAKIPYQSLVLLDECEEIFALIEETDDEKKPRKKLISRGDILSLLDGYAGLNGCILVMTTNFIERIDPAIKRPGRIDQIFEIKPCSVEQIKRILKLYTGEHFKHVDVSQNLTSSELINRIILPNLGNRKKILELLSG